MQILIIFSIILLINNTFFEKAGADCSDVEAFIDPINPGTCTTLTSNCGNGDYVYAVDNPGSDNLKLKFGNVQERVISTAVAADTVTLSDITSGGVTIELCCENPSTPCGGVAPNDIKAGIDAPEGPTSAPTVFDTCPGQGLCFTNDISDCCSVQGNTTCIPNPEAGFCTSCKCTKPPKEIAKIERKSTKNSCGISGECFFDCSQSYVVSKRGDEYRFESPPVNGCNCCKLRALPSKTGNTLVGAIIENPTCDGPPDLTLILSPIETGLVEMNSTTNGSTCSAIYTEVSGQVFFNSDLLYYIAIGCGGYVFLVLCAIFLVWKCRRRSLNEGEGNLYRNMIAYHLLNIVSIKRTYTFLFLNCIFALMAYFIEQIEGGSYLTGAGRTFRSFLVISYAVFKLRGLLATLLLWFMFPFLLTVLLIHWLMTSFCLPSPFGALLVWSKKAFLDLDQDDIPMIPKKIEIPLTAIKQMDQMGNLSNVTSRNSVTPIRLIEQPVPEAEFQTFKRKKITKLSYPLQVCLIDSLDDESFYKMDRCSIPLRVQEDTKSLTITGKLFMLYCGKSSKLNSRRIFRDIKKIQILDMDKDLYTKCVAMFFSDIRTIVINDAAIILSLLIGISTVFEPDTDPKWSRLRKQCIDGGDCINFQIVNSKGEQQTYEMKSSTFPTIDTSLSFVNFPILVDNLSPPLPTTSTKSVTPESEADEIEDNDNTTTTHVAAKVEV